MATKDEPKDEKSHLDPNEVVSVDEARKTLQSLLQRNGNEFCADCSSKKCSWASVNLGIFLCTNCAGVHRSMGVHISFVQSITLDTKWKRKWLQTLTSGISNDHQNIEYEYHVPSKWYKPVEDEPRSYRESYIKAKYQDKLFRKGEGDNQTRRPSLYGKHIQERKKGQDGMISAAVLNGDVEANNVGMTEFQGVVFVTLTKAKNLAASDIGGSSDPYVKIRIGRQTVKSKTVTQCLNPGHRPRIPDNNKKILFRCYSVVYMRVCPACCGVGATYCNDYDDHYDGDNDTCAAEWNEKLILSWTGESKHELEIEVWDEDLISDDDLLGKARINLSGISSTEPVGLHIPLQDDGHTTSVSWKDLVIDPKSGAPNKILAAADKKRAKYCTNLLGCFGVSRVSGYVIIDIRFEKIE
eukprot:jgi/Bigna1/144934/aug1.93_g19642